MYRKYWYKSGVNEKMVKHLSDLAMSIKLRQPAIEAILDIGSNDWTFLNNFPEYNYTRIGFDPSDVYAEGRGLYVPFRSICVNDYFSATGLFKVYPKKVDVVTSIAMFYDLDDPINFAQQVKRVLKPGGLWVIEMHYLPAMVESVGFDAICHEHLAYYNLTSLEKVLDAVDMVVTDVEFNGMNGGSFRVFVRRTEDATGVNAPDAERLAQVRDMESRVDYSRFADKIRASWLYTHNFFTRNKDKLILGYGASTKGNTLLQYFELGPSDLPVIADRDPRKHGLETAGTRIPIVSEEAARAMHPDFFYTLPYHFLPVFMKRESLFLKYGGRFIHPLPTPILWSKI
jgi:SAM-dependent methyltransferase